MKIININSFIYSVRIEEHIEKKFYFDFSYVSKKRPRKLINNFIFDKDVNQVTIRLTLKQLIYVGIHLGHLKRNSRFLSSWLFFGWRHNIFIIDLVKTLLLAKMSLLAVKKVIRYGRPFWFVTMNTIHGPLLARYASICGEPYNVFWWIGGTLTNLKMILDWNVLLINLMKRQQYLFRHQDKKRLMYLFGFLKQRTYEKGDDSKIAKTIKFLKKKEKISYSRKVFSHNRLYRKRNKIMANPDYGAFPKFQFLNFKVRMRWFYMYFYEISWRKPGGGFIPTMLDNWRIVDEFAVSDLPFITLVDSDVRSNDIMLPIPSNDDSIQCIIFFTYLIVKTIFLSKLFIAKRWKYGLVKNKKLKYSKFKYVFLKNLENKEFLSHDDKFSKLLDDVFLNNIMPFDIKNHIKYNMFIADETMFSSTTDFDFMKLKFKNFII
jgi:ribosomal protein S2